MNGIKVKTSPHKCEETQLALHALQEKVRPPILCVRLLDYMSETMHRHPEGIYMRNPENQKLVNFKKDARLFRCLLSIAICDDETRENSPICMHAVAKILHSDVLVQRAVMPGYKASLDPLYEKFLNSEVELYKSSFLPQTVQKREAYAILYNKLRASDFELMNQNLCMLFNI